MTRRFWSQLASDYGMAVVLVLLCIYYSLATLQQQHPTGTAAARQVAKAIGADGRPKRLMIVAGTSREDILFADSLSNLLVASKHFVTEVVKGSPSDARGALERVGSGEKLDVIACTPAAATWAVFDRIRERYANFASTEIVVPAPYRWPNFLKAENLINIVNQISVIAIVAVGMTMVIITGGIDLSVGSLIALSAVTSTLAIRDVLGGEPASAAGMVISCLAAIAFCGLVGLFSGAMITTFAIPAFIATLAMMLVASGLAFLLAAGQSVYQVPDSFVWLGRGVTAGLPNSVILMVLLYIAAHVLMSRTRLGRYIYAVGGNAQAARFSGVPVKKVVLICYVLSGALAGVGGIVTASQLKSGAPTYGQMYELYVIAAVVVGGTSLSGGEGKVFGTLIGAFIIAVIQNGMNLTGVESYTQKVVLGVVILAAVLIDMLKRRGQEWIRGYWGRQARSDVEVPGSKLQATSKLQDSNLNQ
jgi:ribose transport system permease protein